MIADDDRIDGRYLEVHQWILSLLALQAPVAGDLRIIAALLHVIKHVERMGDQCVNIAKLIPLAGNEPPVAPEILASSRGWARSRARRSSQSKQAFALRDVALAEDLVRQDARDQPAQPRHLPPAVDVGDRRRTRASGRCTMMLVARALERIGDNAVDVGEQVAFVVSGLFREFSDASHPVDAS